MSLNPPRVLIVDDEECVLSSLTAFLSDLGMDVSGCSSGEEALRLLPNRIFDAAIVDMRLPGIDGDTVIRCALSCQPGLRVFIHTGSTDYQIPGDLKALGDRAPKIIRKPILDLRGLAKTIMQLVKDEPLGDIARTES